MENISFEGIITKSTGGLYTVEKKDGTYEDCRAKGAFRHSKITPLAGDRVSFEKGEFVDLNQISPIYLRASQAEIERNKRLNK